jgi:putative transposase
MNDGFVHADLAGAALPPLLAFACAPLVVKTTTIRCKVMPEAYAWLDQAAREVNQVWNFANATSHEALNSYAYRSLPPGNASSDPLKIKKPAKEKTREQQKWLSAFDLNALVAGCGEVFDKIGIDVAQKVNAEFVNKRSQFKKSKLKFRSSGGSHRALGWVPFKAANIRQKGNSLTFMGKRIRLFNSDYYFDHRRAAIKVCEGNFAQNSLGEWFFNQVMEIAFVSLGAFTPGSKVGLDPGKDITLSTGEKLLYSFYREAEEKLAQLQRRGHKKQAKHLNADIKNKRLNQQHQDTTRLIRENSEIYIGDNSVARMKQKKGCVRMGKSISDNAIGQFKTLLQYKGHWAGRRVVLVSEHHTTQACCNCGLLNGPKGLRQLGVRKWQCAGCETVHDRDINSAVNMLTAEPSSKNAAFQPRNGLPLAGTR